MAKSRQQFPGQDASPNSMKSRDWDNTSRWSDYLNIEGTSPSTSSTWQPVSSEGPQNSGSFQKALNMESVLQLTEVAGGLLTKMYRLNQLLDYPDSVSYVFSEAFWKAGVIPNYPRICLLVAKKFPEHPSKLQLERVDKVALDSLHENAEGYLRSLEPWVMLLLDLMAFREQALRIILDLSSTVITLLVSIFAFHFLYPRMQFKVLEAVGPIIFLSVDTKKLRNEGFLSPFHPRYPDILTNSAHPMRAQDLANVTSYREWVLFGYLVCPDELLRVTSIDIAMVVLKENLILTLFRDEYILLHEDYQLYVLPRILESKKMAKSGRAKQKEADLEYNVAKQFIGAKYTAYERVIMLWTECE
ncbi:histone chaperone [Asimina triloba]